jgi:HAD superfamily hydrolase (TIGR01490 family)
MSKKYTVFFDLDRTLIREISGKAIVKMAWKKGLISWGELANAFYLYAQLKLRLKDPLKVIEGMVGWVKGKTETEMEELCLHVFKEDLYPSLFRKATTEIDFHIENDAKIIILSSALDFVCRAMSERMRLDGYICSALESEGGSLTGRPVGKLCYGEEKLNRLTGYCDANNLNQSVLWYYTDSISDLPVLCYVGNPVCVNPDRELKKEAIKRGWKILSWQA